MTEIITFVASNVGSDCKHFGLMWVWAMTVRILIRISSLQSINCNQEKVFIPKTCLQDKWTPIHIAASRGHADVVRFLASLPGVNVDTCNKVCGIMRNIIIHFIIEGSRTRVR